MPNRKLFRMRHEPCKGTCYTPAEVLNLTLFTPAEAFAIVTTAKRVHDQICGDARFGVGVDMDEARRLLVGHVVSPAGVETLVGHVGPALVLEVLALAEERIAEHPPTPDLGSCDHGSEGNFVAFWREHCGAPEVLRG